MQTPEEFSDIRPYESEEIGQVFDELAVDPQFREVMSQALPQVPFDAIIAKGKSCKTLLEFQLAFDYPFLKQLLQSTSTGIDFTPGDLDRQGSYTFVSNHRDIVLDSALLCLQLVDAGFRTTAEIAIGNNLLVYPWIKHIVRLNKSFIVKRAPGLREQLTCSRQLSGYLHYAISQKHENIWIAQREGRAKDANDRTQQSILKMMAMRGEGNSIREHLMQLHIVPLAISYEYDPCDCLKAKEFQQKRDNANYKKTQQNDLINMRTGIFGFKGRIHYQASACLDTWLAQQPDSITNNELFEATAKHIDHAIHSNYRLYKLKGGSRFAQLYTDEELHHFEDYLSGQIARIDLPSPDHDFLQHKLLEMYANPLINYLAAAEQRES